MGFMFWLIGFFFPNLTYLKGSVGKIFSMDLVYDRKFFCQFEISAELENNKSHALNSYIYVHTKCSSNGTSLSSVIKVGVVDTLVEKLL